MTVRSGSLSIFPVGPYKAGQEIVLLASDEHLIDAYNSVPRVCATVNGSDEVCDPGWVPFQRAVGLPEGLQGVTVELPRWFFGPDGDHDCGTDAVVCRLRWQTEDKLLLVSPPLDYSGPNVPRPITIDADVGDAVGTVAVTAAGFDSGALASEVFTPLQMRIIEEAVSPTAAFDVENLTLEWGITAFCGFGPGGPPIGSETLIDTPSWWEPETDLSAAQSVSDSFYGGVCDWVGVDNPSQLAEGQETQVDVQRLIYGYGGWLDCADSACYLEMTLRWLYPMPDGSTLGSDETVARVLVDVPSDWPAVYPSITIAEPGPYRPGQQVSIEVRDHELRNPGVGWCLGGETYCQWKSASYSDGVYRTTWELPPSSGCQNDRCYFAINSFSEGLPPPAIVTINIDE